MTTAHELRRSQQDKPAIKAVLMAQATTALSQRHASPRLTWACAGSRQRLLWSAAARALA